jgi:hypothetical protein
VYPKSLGLRCVQNGPPTRREEGAYLNRYVTDEQRSRRPTFIATLRAAAKGMLFRGQDTILKLCFKWKPRQRFLCALCVMDFFDRCSLPFSGFTVSLPCYICSNCRHRSCSHSFAVLL